MPTHTTGSNFEPGPSACRSANLIERRLGERRNSLRDEMGSFIVCENIGVENHMVEQRVIDILLEILFQIPFPAQVFPTHCLQSLLMVYLLQLFHVPEATFQRPYQTNME